MTSSIRARSLWGPSTLLAGVLFVAAVLLEEAVAGDHEKLLYDRLQHGYNRLARPVRNESSAVVVTLGMDLQQILDVDEKSQTITTNVWMRISWTDVYLSWDPSEYGGIKEVRLPIDSIWKPDVLLYNSVEQRFDTMWPVNAIVTHNGNVTWIPPAITRSACRIEITWFPFDEQECRMKFGSWSYSSFHTDLYNRSVSLDPYTPNGEWILLSVMSMRNLRVYDCCPLEPYIDVTFVMNIRRRTLYYGFNLVIPSVLISSLALLSFTLPPDSGEKLNLCVTILVSLSIFMVMVAETMPQTADSLPLIAIYFTCVMFEVGASVVCTVLVLNFHHRDAECYVPMTSLQRKILLKWLPWLLCMRRPPRIKIPFSYDHVVAFKRPKRDKRPKGTHSNGVPAELHLDTIDVDRRLFANPQTYAHSNGFIESGAGAGKEKEFGDGDITHTELHLDNCPLAVQRKRLASKNAKRQGSRERYFLFTRADPARVGGTSTHLAALHDNLLLFDHGTGVREERVPLLSRDEASKDAERNNNHNGANGNDGGTASDSGIGTGSLVAAFSESQFATLVSHLRVLTARTQKEELHNEVRAEWIFAARVIDRICFISFTAFLLTCTGTIVWKAPHLIV